MFEDKEICIVNGPASHPKTLLETKVAEVLYFQTHINI